MDAWEKIRAANPEVSKNIGALEAKAAPWGSRPDPRTYLGEEYVANHLAKFEDGVSCLAPSNVINNYKQLGRSDGLFVIPKKEMDDLLKRTGGDIRKIEEELGIPNREWSKKEIEIVRFDINKENINNLRMSSGNEAGANSEWIPGGFTPTGNSEAVINSVEWDNVIQIEISGNR